MPLLLTSTALKANRTAQMHSVPRRRGHGLASIGLADEGSLKARNRVTYAFIVDQYCFEGQ